MFSQEGIHKHNKEQQIHLLEMVGDTEVSKAISQEEFNESYGSSHDIFTSNSIRKFQNEVSKSIGSDLEESEAIIEKAMSELSSLTRVLVKSENGISEVYVRELSKGCINEEGDDLEKGKKDPSDAQKEAKQVGLVKSEDTNEVTFDTSDEFTLADAVASQRNIILSNINDSFSKGKEMLNESWTPVKEDSEKGKEEDSDNEKASPLDIVTIIDTGVN